MHLDLYLRDGRRGRVEMEGCIFWITISMSVSGRIRELVEGEKMLAESRLRRAQEKKSSEPAGTQSYPQHEKSK